MRLTDHTDYLMQVLMYLNQEQRQITLSELSENLRISRNNLIKVSNQLAKFNFVEATRGRSGGLMIKPETGLKTIKDIILKTEESFHITSCFAEGKSQCTFLKNCALRATLKKALKAFLDTLDTKTLNDITPKKPLGAKSANTSS